MNEFLLQPLFLVIGCCYLLGFGVGCGCFLFEKADQTWRSSVVSLWFSLLGSIGLLAVGLVFLLAGEGVPVAWSYGGNSLSQLAGVDFTIKLLLDPLAAFFLVITAELALMVTLFSLGWLKDNPKSAMIAGWMNLFIFATALVYLVDNAFWLLVCLELTTVVFGALIFYKSAGRDNGFQRQGRISLTLYMIICHLSTLCLAVAVLILASKHHTLDLSQFGHTPLKEPGLANTVFLLTLAGTGLRMGMVPFHFWVPLVHTQLPANAHAFALGAVAPGAIFLMIRLGFQSLAVHALWWGVLMLLLGGLTALTCVYFALMCRELKVVLAYHSVANMGLILIGMGMASLYLYNTPADHPGAGLALLASLCHILNHALFMALLCLGGGCLERMTGTETMSLMGGVLLRQPLVGLPFLMGCFAIVGFPPLNGFISEWLTLESLFAASALFGGKSEEIVLLAAVPFTLMLVVLTFALTALSFIKVVGDVLLGTGPQQAEKKECHAGSAPQSETEKTGLSLQMIAVLLGLALVCLLVGVFPVLVLPAIIGVVESFGYQTGLSPAMWGVVISIENKNFSYQSGILSPIFYLILVFPILYLLSKITPPKRTTPTFFGGEHGNSSKMRPGGIAFVSLSAFLRSRRTTGESESASLLPSAYSVGKDHEVTDFFNRFYNRAVARMNSAAFWFGEVFQNGDIRIYLLYIFVTLIFTLMVV